MAKSVWRATQDLAAFGRGQDAARQGLQRIAPSSYRSYNEKAAFNDGWDSIIRPPSRRALPKRAGAGAGSRPMFGS